MLTTETRCVCTDHQYKELREAVNENFLAAANSGESLLTTDAGDLFSVYLEAIPEEYRQEYNCHACKDFFNRYGSIVTVLEDGTLRMTLSDAIEISFIMEKSTRKDMDAAKEQIKGKENK